MGLIFFFKFQIDRVGYISKKRFQGIMNELG